MEALQLNLSAESLMVSGFAFGWLAGTFGALVRWLGRGNVASEDSGM